MHTGGIAEKQVYGMDIEVNNKSKTQNCHSFGAASIGAPLHFHYVGGFVASSRGTPIGCSSIGCGWAGAESKFNFRSHMEIGQASKQRWENKVR